MRSGRLAEVWGASPVLLAYPRTRLLYLLPMGLLPFVGALILVPPGVVIAAGETAAAVGVGIGLLLMAVVALVALTLLVIDSFRTSLLVVEHGIELRQFPLSTRRVRWQDLYRVEAQQTGYRTGASVLVLRTGERIVCMATDPRRAMYNGLRMRDFRAVNGRMFSPTTQELISLHRDAMQNPHIRKNI